MRIPIGRPAFVILFALTAYCAQGWAHGPDSTTSLFEQQTLSLAAQHGFGRLTETPVPSLESKVASEAVPHILLPSMDRFFHAVKKISGPHGALFPGTGHWVMDRFIKAFKDKNALPPGSLRDKCNAVIVLMENVVLSSVWPESGIWRTAWADPDKHRWSLKTHIKNHLFSVDIAFSWNYKNPAAKIAFLFKNGDSEHGIPIGLIRIQIRNMVYEHEILKTTDQYLENLVEMDWAIYPNGTNDERVPWRKHIAFTRAFVDPPDNPRNIFHTFRRSFAAWEAALNAIPATREKPDGVYYRLLQSPMSNAAPAALFQAHA